MIKISSPQISTRNGLCYVSCRIASDSMKLDEEIWYRSEAQYGRYFVNETADAFVLPMLLLALKNQEDVEIQAPLSEKLYYNITHNILYTLAIPLKVKSDIKVSCSKLVNYNYGSSAVGCGCSLGVDSFSAMVRHMSNDCPAGFRISHLTNFNVGAYGNDFDSAHDFYEEALVDVRHYCQEVNTPLVTIESNFGIYFKGVNFNWSGPIRTMSAALSMQKLFKRYYYASGSTNELFSYSTTMCEFASLVLPMLSTESCEIIVVDQDKDRIKKTALIVNDTLVQKYLDVCWKRVWANNRGRMDLLDIPFRNCTRCGKCQRTLLTIDAMGCMDKYTGIFDVDYYKTHREEYIQSFVQRKNQDHYHQEVFKLLSENGMIKETSKQHIAIVAIKKMLKRFLCHK